MKTLSFFFSVLKIAVCCLALAVTYVNSYNFSILYEWSQIEYEYSSDSERSEAISNGSFAEGTIQPIDVQYTKAQKANASERMFITTPRLVEGVPASLSIVTNKVLNGNPIIRPYPSWSWHQNPKSCNNHRIVSVFRVWADECNRLWVMDNGIVGATFVCVPQILVFNLSTDELLFKYEIPYDQYQNVSWYLTPIAEVDHKCDNSWLYVADPKGPSLLVYSLAQNSSWRVQDSSFEASSKWRTYNISGESFTASDGIITLALSPSSSKEGKRLNYHAMANINETYVFTSSLKNKTNFKSSDYSSVFHTYQGKRDQQSCIEAYDREGNLYFSLLIDVELAKWNSRISYEDSHFEIIGNNKKTMQFPSGLKIDPYHNREGLWVFATAFQRFASGNLHSNETNFRILFTEL